METAKAIEEAVAQGTQQFIIDLRGNGGGNVHVGYELPEAMGVQVPMPMHGSIWRVSDLSRERMERLGTYIPPGIDRYDRIPDMTMENPNNVFVSVLTDTYSFSAATMIQDGGLGNVVGQPSANSPSAFMQTFPFTLPDSQIQLTISETWIMRPDINADQNTLWPDIMVPAEDALDAALEFLQNLDVSN